MPPSPGVQGAQPGQQVCANGGGRPFLQTRDCHLLETPSQTHKPSPATVSTARVSRRGHAACRPMVAGADSVPTRTPRVGCSEGGDSIRCRLPSCDGHAASPSTVNQRGRGAVSRRARVALARPALLRPPKAPVTAAAGGRRSPCPEGGDSEDSGSSLIDWSKSTVLMGQNELL